MGGIVSLVATTILVCAVVTSSGGAASRQEDTSKLVTVVARVCKEYTDVTANRARNDIQESLQDLGADTLYTDGQAIDPVLEKQGQPNPPCVPLPNWTFTLGTGIGSPVAGTWGSLSTVSNPFSSPTPIKTLDSTKLLNDKGEDTDRTIAGATTITLTNEQANLAGNPDSLWIQGGTPDDPILNKQFPGRTPSPRSGARSTT